MGRLLVRNFSGPSIKFDGSVTKIVVGDLTDKLVGRSSFTLSAWVNLSGARNKFIIGVRNIAAFNTALGLLVTSGTDDVQVVGRATGGSTLIAPSYGFAGIKRKWALLTGTINLLTGVGNLYINGTLVATNTQAQVQTTLAADPTSLTCEIGATGVSGLLFDNYIAEPAIFNRVLTAEEIRAIYEQGPVAYPKDGSCVLDYRFKEGAINGAQIIDSSGKGNHGTLTIGSGIIDPYNIPVPNRVVIPGNMPLVAVESTGTIGIQVPDSVIAAAFGVAAGQVGVNGLSGGAFVKKKRHITNYQTITQKGQFGAAGYGGYIDCSDALNKISGILTGPGSVSITTTSTGKRGICYTNYSWVNGVTYGKSFHDGLLVKNQSAVLQGNGIVAFSLISLGSGNITAFALPFLANRVLTDEEIYNIYSKAIFPADVLFWHGPDETGTKIACHRGTYGNRVSACDATLGTGNAFTDDVPWR